MLVIFALLAMSATAFAAPAPVPQLRNFGNIADFINSLTGLPVLDVGQGEPNGGPVGAGGNGSAKASATKVAAQLVNQPDKQS